MLHLGDGDGENTGECRGLFSSNNWDMVYFQFISVTHATYHHSFGACTVERDISAPQEAYLDTW